MLIAFGLVISLGVFQSCQQSNSSAVGAKDNIDSLKANSDAINCF